MCFFTMHNKYLDLQIYNLHDNKNMEPIDSFSDDASSDELQLVNILSGNILSFSDTFNDDSEFLSNDLDLQNNMNFSEWSDDSESYIIQNPNHNIPTITNHIPTLDISTISTIPPTSRILIIGMRGSGKTVIANSILRQFNDEFISNSLLISPTEYMFDRYAHTFPHINCVEHFDDGIVGEYMNGMPNVLREPSEPGEPGAIVLDDCIGSQWIDRSPNENTLQLLNENNNYNKLVIVTMQFPIFNLERYGCHFDYIFLLSEAFSSNQRRLYEQYKPPGYNTFEEFRTDLINVTDNYGSFVIHNRGQQRMVYKYTLE